MGKLAEKVAGRARKYRVLWGGQRRNSTFKVGLENMASAFPRADAMDGGQFRSIVHKTVTNIRALAFARHFSIVATLTPHSKSTRYLFLQIGKLRFKDWEGAKVMAKLNLVSQLQCSVTHITGFGLTLFDST